MSQSWEKQFTNYKNNIDNAFIEKESEFKRLISKNHIEGIIDKDRYNKAKYKILFIAHEPYCKTEQELTMNNIFRFMESYGFAKSWTNWRDYYAKRNSTAHEYNIEKSRRLIEIIPEFLDDVNFLLAKSYKMIEKDLVKI